MITNLPAPNVTYHQPDGMTEHEAMMRANKLYLVFLTLIDEHDDEFKDWELCMGTQRAYDYAKEMIMDGCVDFENSYVLVDSEKENLRRALPIYEFMKNMIERGKVIIDPEFNLEDYYDPELADDDNEYDEPRYGQGDNPVPYTSMTQLDGGEV